MVTKLNLDSRQLMRRKEFLHTQLKLEKATLSQATLIPAMIDHLILIEWPVVVANDQVGSVRPPVSVLEVLE